MRTQLDRDVEKILTYDILQIDPDLKMRMGNKFYQIKAVAIESPTRPRRRHNQSNNDSDTQDQPDLLDSEEESEESEDSTDEEIDEEDEEREESPTKLFPISAGKPTISSKRCVTTTERPRNWRRLNSAQSRPRPSNRGNSQYDAVT